MIILLSSSTLGQINNQRKLTDNSLIIDFMLRLHSDVLVPSCGLQMCCTVSGLSGPRVMITPCACASGKAIIVCGFHSTVHARTGEGRRVNIVRWPTTAIQIGHFSSDRF